MRPGGRLHWRDLTEADQRRVAAAVADLGVGSSTWWARVEKHTRQERARHKILAALYALAGEEVSRVVLETRHRERNRRDAEAVESFRRTPSPVPPATCGTSTMDTVRRGVDGSSAVRRSVVPRCRPC